MLTALKPVLVANDPLPAEILAAADGACHAANELLMRTSTVAGGIRRGISLDAVEVQLGLAATKARSIAEACERARERVAAIRLGGRR